MRRSVLAGLQHPGAACGDAVRVADRHLRAPAAGESLFQETRGEAAGDEIRVFNDVAEKALVGRQAEHRQLVEPGLQAPHPFRAVCAPGDQLGDH